MTTGSDERKAGIRDRLNDRSSGIRSNLQERSDNIQSELNSRHVRLRGGLFDDLVDIMPPPRQPPRLPREEPRGGIPARRGYNEVNLQPGQGGTGGGIASPLTEGLAGVPQLERTYHPFSSFVYANDFAIAVAIRPLESLKMYDANGDLVVLNFADPQV
ncbi:MAG: hypothetical protein CVV07_07415 [Gammaproteobacteria bacterium HGW-Gammaproteobacteria-11]|nr:MAG: hypothetical protein CVV07_07415 [Gammaproteobacteria bacterium HGW-Gammaproteobacteria-11]